MTRLLIDEPSGLREFDGPCRIGGIGCGIVVPAVAAGEGVELTVEQGGLWLRTTATDVGDQALRPLAPGEIFVVGDASIRIDAITPDAVRMSVMHHVGNATLEPFATSIGPREDSEDVPVVATATEASRPVSSSTGRLRVGRGSIAIGVLVILVVTMMSARWQPVQVVVIPAEAKVRGSGLSWRAAETLWLWPGERTVTASLDGYRTSRRSMKVEAGVPLRIDLRLAPLPGVLAIDTAGVPATVYVDGAEIGRAPGDIEVMGGERTVRLRADRYLDSIQRMTVTGRGVRQALSVTLQPSWGRLEVSSSTPGARVRLVQGGPSTPLPATLDLPAGMHRLAIEAAGAKAWQSAVLVRGGVTERVGPITLGLPDAELRVTSVPSGAEVLIAGVFRGRTPLNVSLSPGIEHEVTIGVQGYRPSERRVRAESGRRQSLAVTLQPIPVSVTLRGEPAGAEVVIDGTVRGVTPLTLDLPARRHLIDVRRAGSEPRRLEVDLSSAEARTLEYRLVPVGRPPDWKPPPSIWRAQSGTSLRLIPGGEFLAGSDRREQGRRANEFQRRVTLSRPFYIGLREVTNGEFRRFKPGHASGFIGRRSLDLDGIAVTQVSWAEAVQYCNWLSEQDGLPPAYVQQGGQWVLKQPVPIGYRLPSEAEWEFVTRHARGGRTQRYEWGDVLPPPPALANLAGREAAAELPQVLEGWQDDYEVAGPPGRFPANGLGLFDLTGNVSEWVHDVYASFDGGGAVTDPLGPAPAAGSRRVVKGSHWRTASFSELRAAWRDGRQEGSAEIGFRVARYAE